MRGWNQEGGGGRRGGGGGAAAENEKEDEAKKEENLYSHAKRIKRLNTQTEQMEKDILSKKPWYMRGGAVGKDLPSFQFIQKSVFDYNMCTAN